MNELANIEAQIANSPEIATMLPPDVPVDKFRSVALAAIRNNPSLLRCDQRSLFNACLAAAQDGLLPDGREGAIVPRKGKAVWQPMVQGIYKRVKSSGSVASLAANVVYEGETFDVLLGDDDRIVHRRDMAKVGGPPVAVYAIATLKDGTKEREVMTWEQVLVVRQSSASPNDGPWVTWPDEMARKTVVRRLAKRLPVLDPADERLHHAINRVDSLYNFGTPAPEAPQREAITAAEVPLTPKQQRMRGVDATGKPWRSAEGEDADRAEAAERERAAAAAVPKAERKIDPTVYDTAEPTDADKWWFNLETKLATAQSQAEIMKIGELKSVKAARESPIPEVQERVMELLANAYERFPTDTKTWTRDLSDEALGEVEIAGSEKVGAG